jgi:hypothetical protein
LTRSSPDRHKAGRDAGPVQEADALPALIQDAAQFNAPQKLRPKRIRGSGASGNKSEKDER